MKRVMAWILTVILVIGCVGCGGRDEGQKEPETSQSENGNGENKAEKYVIGVGEYMSGAEAVTRKAYFENYIAPAYNVEFIFSEPLGDTEAELSFVENIVQAGADAYIGFRADDAEQIAQVCEEYGLYYCINSNRNAASEAAFTGGYSHFLGAFAADQPATGDLFRDWLNEVASESGEEGFMIASGLAFNGVVQHYECTVAILDALQKKYDLEFTDSIENIAVTSAPLEVSNDKGIHIYIYPGSVKNETWLQGISAGLQSGKYQVFLQAIPTFSQTAVVVDEVEHTYNMNIKTASMASISDALTNAFHTQDMFGNPSLDMATVKITSLLSGLSFVKVYNALTGYNELNRDANDEPIESLFKIWSVTTTEELDTIGMWDVAETDSWVFDIPAIDRCLGIKNPNLTAEEIEDVIYGIDYASTKERMR